MNSFPVDESNGLSRLNGYGQVETQKRTWKIYENEEEFQGFTQSLPQASK